MTAPSSFSPDVVERFTFGQPVENIAASEDNPAKRGFFIRGSGSMVEYASPLGVHRTPANNLRASQPATLREVVQAQAEVELAKIQPTRKWDEGEHEGCGIDSQIALERQAARSSAGGYRAQKIVAILNRMDYRNQTPQRLAEAIVETAGDASSSAVIGDAAKIAELEGVIDRADAHTAMLMKSISHLETKLKAAEYAAKVNYDGWQQEMARSGAAQPPSIDLMQRVWANLYYNEEDAGSTFQQTLNEVVDWLAARNALPEATPISSTEGK